MRPHADIWTHTIDVDMHIMKQRAGGVTMNPIMEKTDGKAEERTISHAGLFALLDRLSRESAEDTTPSRKLYVSGEESFKGLL